MAKIVGIDPGISGAIALLERGCLSWARDLPLVAIAKDKRIVDCVALASILAHAEPDLVMVERVSASPGMGVGSAFAFGCTYGLIMAAVKLSGCQLELVTPQAWKAALACPADKSLSAAKATKLFGTSEHWPRVKDHGRAEAALIAHYAGLKHKRDHAA